MRDSFRTEYVNSSKYYLYIEEKIRRGRVVYRWRISRHFVITTDFDSCLIWRKDFDKVLKAGNKRMDKINPEARRRYVSS